MEKIPTAEKILNDKVYITKDGIEDVHDSLSTVADVMIEFARLHVEAALKEASEKIKLTDEVCEVLQEHWFEEYIDKSSILNSYPLDKIK